MTDLGLLVLVYLLWGLKKDPMYLWSRVVPTSASWAVFRHYWLWMVARFNVWSPCYLLVYLFSLNHSSHQSIIVQVTITFSFPDERYSCSVQIKVNFREINENFKICVNIIFLRFCSLSLILWWVNEFRGYNEVRWLSTFYTDKNNPLSIEWSITRVLISIKNFLV